MPSTGPAGPWRHEFARVDGVRLHYVRQGAGTPVVLLHGWPGFWYQIFHTLPWAHELVGANREATRLYLRHFLTHWSGRKGWVTDQELDHWVDAYSQPGALRGGFAYYKAYERVRTTQADAPVETLRVEVPTLVLWGDADAILPVAWADRLPEYFAKLTLKRVPGVGHFMMREAPDLVVDEVRAFLGGAP